MKEWKKGSTDLQPQQQRNDCIIYLSSIAEGVTVYISRLVVHKKDNFCDKKVLVEAMKLLNMYRFSIMKNTITNNISADVKEILEITINGIFPKIYGMHFAIDDLCKILGNMIADNANISLVNENELHTVHLFFKNLRINADFFLHKSRKSL